MGLDETPAWMRTESESRNTAALVGHLSQKENQVRHRQHDSLIWRESQTNEPLFENESVLTLSHSRAQIDLGGVTKLNLGENTLVVLEADLRERIVGRAAQPLIIHFTRGRIHTENTDRPLLIASENFKLSVAEGSQVSIARINKEQISVEVEAGSSTLDRTGLASQNLQSGNKIVLSDVEMAPLRLPAGTAQQPDDKPFMFNGKPVPHPAEFYTQRAKYNENPFQQPSTNNVPIKKPVELGIDPEN